MHMLALMLQVAERHAGVFRADATRNLVTRLHHNVLRTGWVPPACFLACLHGMAATFVLRTGWVSPSASISFASHQQVVDGMRHAGVWACGELAPLSHTPHSNHTFTRSLRRIALAYSRISLADVASKLHLPSVEDAGGCETRLV